MKLLPRAASLSFVLSSWVALLYLLTVCFAALDTVAGLFFRLSSTGVSERSIPTTETVFLCILVLVYDRRASHGSTDRTRHFSVLARRLLHLEMSAGVSIYRRPSSGFFMAVLLHVQFKGN